jgi:hypothetical protein
MHHASARSAVDRILASSSFGDQALALCLAAAVGDLPGADENLRARLMARAAAMAPDRAAAYAGPLLDAPVPGEAAALAAQIAPLISAHPSTVGNQLAALDAVCALWPHVASAERAALRARLLAGCSARQAAPGSFVTTAQLCAWQRDLPTGSCDSPPSVASLKSLLSATQPHLAYHVIAEHLGCQMDLPTLHWALGALSVQVLLRLRDPQGLLVQCLLGTVAGERLAALTPPENLATLIGQLTHELWWCSNHAGLPPVRSCLDAPPQPLLQAVRGGDITAAQRAARAVSTTPERFWAEVWTLVDEAAEWDDGSWLRTLAAASAIAWRTGDAMSPDDAAALGAVLADAAYHARPTRVA